MMNKLADMSEEETEEALRTVGQAISKQVPSITEKILSELKNSILERKNRRKTGEDEEGRLDEGRRGRRGGEDIEDDQWDDALGFGRYYGKTYSDMYRDDQQDSAHKGLTKFQKLLRRVEEKTRDNMRKELEREREEKIRLNELSRAAAAADEERETKTTMDDAIGKHLAAAKMRGGNERRGGG